MHYIKSYVTKQDLRIALDYSIIDHDSADLYVDEWEWNSMILKDMYIINERYMTVGAIFFVANDKYILACYNDGRNLIKVQDDKNYEEFNSQLSMFNYIRATIQKKNI